MSHPDTPAGRAFLLKTDNGWQVLVSDLQLLTIAQGIFPVDTVDAFGFGVKCISVPLYSDDPARPLLTLGPLRKVTSGTGRHRRHAQRGMTLLFGWWDYGFMLWADNVVMLLALGMARISLRRKGKR